MKVLVLGATGYVGSRLVPALLAAGHSVVAASSSPPRPERFAWGPRVEWRQCDVTDAGQVWAALQDVEGVCYLVHSLNMRGFSARDRRGAEALCDAVSGRRDVTRVVYLSGLVPEVPRKQLSAHIASRLEVEEILGHADASVLSLRAGVVIGAGSTSFEVIRQLATLLPVQPVPLWLRHRVQPIAVSDVVRALTEAFDPGSTDGSEPEWADGSLDVGGPDIVRYDELLAECSRAAGLRRLRLPVLAAPTEVVSLSTASLVAAPFWTVHSLIESLRHDMTCRPPMMWVPRDDNPLLGVPEALERCFADPGTVPEAPLPSDPDWTRMRAPVLDELRAPASVRAGASLALRRGRALVGAVSQYVL